MTIENIIKKIETETNAEVNKILKEAKLRANELQKEAKKKITEKLNQTKTQGEKRITIMRNIHLSEARRSARRITLSAKEKLIERCFAQAKEQLRALKGDELVLRMKGWVTADVKKVIEVVRKHGFLKVLDDRELVVEMETEDDYENLNNDLLVTFQGQVDLER